MPDREVPHSSLWREMFGENSSPIEVLAAQPITLEMAPDTTTWSEERCRVMCNARGHGEPSLDDRQTHPTLRDWHEWTATVLSYPQRRPFNWYSLSSIRCAVALWMLGEHVMHTMAHQGPRWWWGTKVEDPRTLRLVLTEAAELWSEAK